MPSDCSPVVTKKGLGLIVNRRTLRAGAAMLSLEAGAHAAAPTIAVVQINRQALFFNQVLQGAQGAAKTARVMFDVFNATNSPTAQNNAVETYI